MSLVGTIDADRADLSVILRDVRALARTGSFSTAARRFGDLRLEDGRHQTLEVAAVESLDAELAAARERLAASRAELRRLEAACATALDRRAPADVEAAAEALEQALGAHAALESSLETTLEHVAAHRAGG